MNDLEVAEVMNKYAGLTGESYTASQILKETLNNNSSFREMREEADNFAEKLVGELQ